jgi:hypothetical protein
MSGCIRWRPCIRLILIEVYSVRIHGCHESIQLPSGRKTFNTFHLRKIRRRNAWVHVAGQIGNICRFSTPQVLDASIVDYARVLHHADYGKIQF